jgi:nicotinate phosphoribosyltransferase
VRLDSGDLAELARAARKILDDAQLEHVEIFASGGLDEYRIAELIRSKAPIAGFGVGTHMGASEDAPTLDMVYKLTEYAGRGRLKASPGKRVLPGRKQVFRRANGAGDTIGRHGESLAGRPLLEPVMRGGRRLAAGRVGLSAARERARSELAALPEALRALDPAPPYPVEISPALSKYHREVMTERLPGG